MKIISDPDPNMQIISDPDPNMQIISAPSGSTTLELARFNPLSTNVYYGTWQFGAILMSMGSYLSTVKTMNWHRSLLLRPILEHFKV